MNKSVPRILGKTVRPSWLAIGAAMAALAGCASDPNGAAAAALSAEPAATPKATPAANVSKLQAWRDAELIASMAPGRTEVIGTGDSMKPVYGDNTILVISKIDFDDLKSGMTVAYLNGRGRHVVHQLLIKEAEGWRIQGLNNENEDTDRVTRGNLIGVVYASLSYSDTP
jgi:hypothetical protein